MDQKLSLPEQRFMAAPFGSALPHGRIETAAPQPKKIAGPISAPKAWR